MEGTVNAAARVHDQRRLAPFVRRGFAHNDLLAIGTLAAIQEAGLQRAVSGVARADVNVVMG